MNKSLFRIDWGLFIPSFVLVLIGISGLLSLNYDLFKTQLIFFLISLIVFVLFSQINFQSIKTLSIPIYFFSIILLLVLLFIGFESRGSVRWLGLFGLGIQFSEILKPFLLICLSYFLIEKNSYTFRSFMTIFLFLAPIFLLIFLQPDLGSAVIYFITTLLVLFAFGFPFRYFLTLFLLGLLSFPIVWKFLKNYQQQRILTFFKFNIDPLGLSYNAIQSVIAVGSGMFLGKGFGQGTQSILRFLPERHTDFMFATLSEELGFIGSFGIILAFSAILYRIYTIFQRTNDNFVKIFSISAFFLLLVQLFINVGMNIGIVPIVGVSLPFVSYGGSSLLSNFMLLGLVSSMSKGLKRKDTLEIK